VHFLRQEGSKGLDSKICAIFYRNRLGYMEDQQVEIAQFFEGTGRELISQKCIILGGNWKLATGSLVAKTEQFPRGTNNQLLGAWQ